MAKGNTKISYDKEEDILDLSRGNPSKASVEIGDFVIDIDFKGFVSAIEILNASENLNISRELLEKIEKASMQIIYQPNYIKIILAFYFHGKEKEILIPLTLDLGHKKVEKEEAVFAR